VGRAIAGTLPSVAALDRRRAHRSRADRLVRHLDARSGGATRDLSVLRTLAQRHRGCLGVYANVAYAGLVRVGDLITLLA
jgi:hypothetical protein